MKIYLAICILTFIVFWLRVFDFCSKLTKHQTETMKQKNKMTVYGRILNFIKIFVASIAPLFNIALLYVLLFKWDDLEKEITKTLLGEV